MSKLNILIIEDNQDDCFLLVDELKYNGFQDIHYQMVQSAAELEATLASDIDWHIVLSDYRLPGFNGIQALRIIKDKNPNIPFILISGAIGEELAVQALKEGANDYLLKDRLFRLPSVIKKELAEAEQRKALDLAQKELLIAKKNAELANLRKTQVLAFVAHEFKNPINAILLHADLLLKGIGGELKSEQQDFVQNITQGTQLLQDLVSDILDIGAIEAGKTQLEICSLNLEEVLDSVQAVIEPIAKKKNIKLNFKSTNITGEFKADPKRLKQILINLLSNGVKYTPESGEVSLDIAENDSDVLFCITDTGVGLTQEEIPQLFNEYYRAYNVFTTQSEGIGLGLAVTKKLVELHQGQISVSSKKGQGTSFKFTLPKNKGVSNIETPNNVPLKI